MFGNGYSNQLLILREIEILSSCPHPTIIKIHHFTCNPWSVVMEYAPNRNLENNFRSLSPTQKSIVMYGLSLGMEFLHASHVVHRDLKPENILMNENFEPKIADFSNSKHLNRENFELSRLCGSFAYSAPELRMCDGGSYPVDIWSFGTILYELITGEYAPPLQNPEDVPPLIFPKNCEEHKLRELVQCCRNMNPCLRPKFSDIVKFIETDPEYRFKGTDPILFEDYMRRVKVSTDSNIIYGGVYTHPEE